MKKNRLALGVAIMGLVASMSGCYAQKQYCTMQIHDNDEGMLSVKCYANKEQMDATNSSASTLISGDDTEKMEDNKQVEEIDGVEYYCTTETYVWGDEEERKLALDEVFAKYCAVDSSEDGIHIIYDKSSKVLSSGLQFYRKAGIEQGRTTEEYWNDILKDSFIDLTVTFDDEIVNTNGTLSEDKKSASFHIDYDVSGQKEQFVSLYAETTTDDSVTSDYQAPVISGMNEGAFVNHIEVKASDNNKIAGIVHGIAMEFNEEEMTAYNFVNGTQNGPLKVYAVDYAGNISNIINVIYDTVKPTVEGVTDKKTYKKAVKIKYGDYYGVKSATINGKKFKSGKKVSAKGTYKVKVIDKAGNETSLSFKIK
ncbi:MAG: hypothetical protein K5895_01485 [Lachnospiraceae bacterium]|nr:hypothetical protein [Lachnospiraceae bacterium]